MFKPLALFWNKAPYNSEACLNHWHSSGTTNVTVKKKSWVHLIKVFHFLVDILIRNPRVLLFSLCI